MRAGVDALSCHTCQRGGSLVVMPEGVTRVRCKRLAALFRALEAAR